MKYMKLYGSGVDEHTGVDRLRRRIERYPHTLLRRRCGVIDTFVGKPKVAQVKRLAVTTPHGEPFRDSTVAASVDLPDGRRDVIIAADVENPLNRKPAASAETMVARDAGVQLRGDLAVVRLDAHGKTDRIVAVNGSELSSGDVKLRLLPSSGLVELQLEDGQAMVVRGRPGDIAELSVDRRRIPTVKDVQLP